MSACIGDRHTEAPDTLTGRRRWRYRLTVVVAFSLAGLLAGAGPVRAAQSDERALSERFAPVVQLVRQKVPCGPGEPYHPSDVEAVLGNDGVALRGPWSQDDLVRIAPTGDDLSRGLAHYHLDLPGNPLEPGCDYEQWARTASVHNAPTVYAHVATEDGRTDRLALQYWFYYPFNDYNNKHEGDWEMIQLVFAAPDAAHALSLQPVQVGYSQHEGLETSAWGEPKLQVVEGTHPVVHPASGSHANFYESSLYLGTSAEQGFGCDDTRNAGDILRPVVRLIPNDDASARAAFPWISYQGHWGQRQESFYNGPTGPNTKSSWVEPISFQEQHARDRSLAVPAGGLLGTGATDFFCSAVADGSDILRHIVDNPSRSLLVLGLLALLAAFLAKRTAWQPSAPRRVPRRRATGQIILASARMYASHRVLFIEIGIVTVPVSLAVTAMQDLVGPPLSSETPGGEEGTVLVLLAGLLGYLLLGIATVLVLAASMAALMEVDAERRVGVGRAYRLALARWRPLVVAFLTASIVLAVLSVTIVLAPVALVLAVLWALFVAVAQLEGSSGLGALRRSAQLVRHQIVRIAFLLLASTLLASVVGAVLGTLVILLTSAPFWLANAVAGITYAVLLPYVGLTMAYAYFDTRITLLMGTPGVPEEVLAAELPEPS